MRIREGFKLRKVCGADVVIAVGVEHVDFSKIINLNGSAAWLWRQVEGKDFDADVLTVLLMEEYEVDEPTARRDVAELLDDWRSANLVR
ncbi:MAG: PqqD family protein [Bacteroidaceae bacterium]